jgi:hypothetical protein
MAKNSLTENADCDNILILTLLLGRKCRQHVAVTRSTDLSESLASHLFRVPLYPTSVITDLLLMMVSGMCEIKELK